MTGLRLAMALLLAATATQGLAQAPPYPGNSGPGFDSNPGPGPDPSKEPFADPLAPQLPDLLKPEEEDAPPVHSVRNEVQNLHGHRTTGEKLTEIRAIAEQKNDPTLDRMGRELLQKRYDRLYHDLHEERMGLTREAIRLPGGSQKKELGRRSRIIADALGGLPKPISAKPRPRFDRSLEADMDKDSDRLRQSALRLDRSSYSQLQQEAGKAINSTDKDEAYRMLAKMKEHYNTRRNSVFYVDHTALKDFRSYIEDYERALPRKWADGPASDAYERPESQPAPRSRGMLPDTFRADSLRNRRHIENADRAGTSRGYTDPMRRHGFGGYGQTDHINQPPADPPVKAAASDDNLPGKQEAPEPPPIGALPEVQGSPEAPGVISMPVNNPPVM